MNIKSLIITSLSLLLGFTHGAGPVESDIKEIISKTEVNHLSDADRSESNSTTSFITRWEVVSPDTIIIPLVQNETYNFTFEWIEATGNTVSSGTHTSADGDFMTPFDIAGGYELHIEGSFPAMRDYPKEKLLDVLQWGAIEWSNMETMFEDWPGTGFTAADAPDLSNVTVMKNMFRGATNFNGDLSSWDVGPIEVMRSMFQDCSSFNQDISQWNTSNVFDMLSMFTRASSFNQDIGGWDVSSVTIMTGLFSNADSFNQDIGDWDISNVLTMSNMFRNNEGFDQSLDKWTFHPDVDLGFIFEQATAISCENYSDLLMGWNHRNPSIINENLGVSPTLNFDATASVSVNEMVNRGWVIPGLDQGNNCSSTTKMYWLGSFTSEWDNQDNWSSSAVPIEGDIVIIPQRPNQPILDITTEAIKSIEILDGGILTIKPTGNLILEDD